MACAAWRSCVVGLWINGNSACLMSWIVVFVRGKHRYSAEYSQTVAWSVVLFVREGWLGSCPDLQTVFLLSVMSLFVPSNRILGVDRVLPLRRL